MSRARALASEPLLHFVLLGLAFFALDHAISRGPRGRAAAPAAARDAPHEIVLGPEVRSGLRDDLQRALGRAPTDEEVEAAMRRYEDQEILYRAGLAAGLDRDDPVVRDRVAAKMGAVLEGEVVPRDPTEDELRAFYDEDPGRFGKAELFDFSQVFVRGLDDAARARAESLLADVRAGADPASLGDTYSGGRKYRRRKLDDLAKSFGQAFADGLRDQAEGSWAVLPSKQGFHVVRVDARRPAEALSFEAARLDVEKALRDRDMQERVRAKMEDLRAEWPIVEGP